MGFTKRYPTYATEQVPRSDVDEASMVLIENNTKTRTLVLRTQINVPATHRQLTRIEKYVYTWIPLSKFCVSIRIVYRARCTDRIK